MAVEQVQDVSALPPQLGVKVDAACSTTPTLLQTLSLPRCYLCTPWQVRFIFMACALLVGLQHATKECIAAQSCVQLAQASTLKAIAIAMADAFTSMYDRMHEP